MKVLLVSEPGIDGVFRHVEGLTRYLLKQNVEVALAYSSRRAGDRLHALLEEMTSQGATTLNLDVGNSPGPADARAIWQLHQLARSFQPDVIHGHSSKGGVLARGLKYLGVNARYFYTPHAYFGMNGGTGARAALYNGLEKLFGKVGHTINMSQGEAGFALGKIGLNPSRQFIICNGVDTDRFKPIASEYRNQLREDLGLPNNAFIFGTVGRTSSQKDPLTTYRALVIAMKSIPEIFFAHLGRGELDAEIDQYIAENGLASRVRRMPYLSDPIPFYQALDGFVLSSIYEGMSFAVLETMSVNLPLVLSFSSGNSDFGDFGLSHLYWNTPRNHEELAESLIRCYQERTSHDRPINHRQIALERFSEAVSYGQTLKAYSAE